MGDAIQEEFKSLTGSVRRLAVPSVGAVFEELGFTYMGPVDGHDIAELTRTFNAAHKVGGPVMVHVATTKEKVIHMLRLTRLVTMLSLLLI